MKLLLLASRFLALALIVLLLWWALRPRNQFTILFDHGRVDFRGRFPDALKPRMARFLQEDVLLRDFVKISGRRRSDGSVALGFRGHVFGEDRQRIRNFLVSIL